MQSVRIYEMPDCKMVASETGMFGDGKLESFDKWFSQQKRCLFPKDFLFWNDSGFRWLYMYEEGMDVPKEFEVIDFKGGLYAVATDIDQQTDMEALNKEVDVFLEKNGFERDMSRKELGNVITSPTAHKIMGYSQMDYYSPIKAK